MIRVAISLVSPTITPLGEGLRYIDGDLIWTNVSSIHGYCQECDNPLSFVVYDSDIVEYESGSDEHYLPGALITGICDQCATRFATMWAEASTDKE